MTHNGPSTVPSGRFYPKYPNSANTQATTHFSAPSRQSTTQPPAPIETSERSLGSHSLGSTNTRFTQAAPVSPVTPGTGYSDIDIQPFLTKVTRPDCAVSTASFPTPEPSNASIASPVVAVRERAGSSSRDASSTAGANVSLPQPAKWEGATPTLPAATSLSPAQQQQRQQPQWSTSQTSSRPSRPPSQPQPQLLRSLHAQSPHQQHQQQQLQQQQTQHPSPSPRGQIWQHARANLDSYILQLNRTKHSSDANKSAETVELPRVRILEDACREEDMFYLALHQTFCLNSADPSQLSQITHQAILPGVGFDVVAQLLVDNKRLSPEFLRWSVEYPMPLRVLLQFEEYRNALKQVSHCLTTISRYWSVFEKEIRSRCHPPQVDELVDSLGVESPVFQQIVFTAICRRLFGAREEPYKACISLFEEDQRTYKQRSMLPVNARIQAIFDFFEKYKQICAYLAVPESSDDRKTFAPRPVPSSVQPAMSMTRTSGNTPHHQNLTPSNTPTSLPHRLPSTAQNVCGRHVHLPANPVSYPHVSPNMVPNAGQQRHHQQQQASHQNFMLNAGAVQSAQAPQPNRFTPQFSGSLPPPPPQYTVASQTPLPANIAAPHQTLPPTLQNQPTFPHMRQNSTGHPASTALHPQYISPVASPNMGPSISSPIQPMFSPTQPPPSNTGQNRRQQPPQRAPQPGPATSSPLTVQLSGTSFPLYPQVTIRPIPPYPSPQIPNQHSPNANPLPDIIQYFSGFSVAPQRLPPNRSSFTWTFTVSREALRLKPDLVRRPTGNGFVPALSDGNMSWRLRCIRYQGRLDVDSIATWSHAESSWPDVVYIHVNNKEVVRSPNMKGSPISINSFLVDGTNEIRVNVLHTKEQRTSNISYAIAVEVLKVKSPENFRKLVKRLPAQETRQQIQARLSSKNTDDDELMIMDDFISIDLRDPFTTRIFEIPVRSLSCTHRECFDLSTFLQTLAVKAMGEKHTIYVRCPICRKDARPDLLVVDDFLSEVRASLSRENKLETAKAIRVKSDGSWYAVLDTESDNRTTTSRKRDRSSFEADFIKDESLPASTPLATAAPEVIELD
ncbi:uncharacterized protein BHQ10_007355 [Talaromyces amestolkiae]|uniref:SP-RING-type domain-containing protein n=1 Tax=Talaromyces amestolkiae TaxID=1196081 RepID=A0A364L6E2_TALAM|nr:uncharacterized protein BHQ10_007355 [Talaromyces amestolkiae]RAO71343.1 hypothetical protein BHQ10_007355 [Talaromyces amestolkiae]